ncbi:MAG: ABC transporter ATP-binding protein [Candidatus Aquicultorales bacterium]
MRLAKYLKPYALSIIVLFVLTFAQVMTELQLPDYMARIVNQGIAGKDTPFILNTGFWMLVVSLIGAVCSIGVGYLAARIASGFAMDLREKLFSKVEGFSLVEFDKFSTASLITRSTNDIQQIQMVFLMLMRMVLMAPIMGIGAIIKAYGMAPSMTWIIALAITVIIGLVIFLFSVAMPKFKLLQKLVDKLNLITREHLTGLRVIRAFNTDKHELERFDKANADLTAVNLFVNRLTVVMQPMMMLVFNLTSIGVIWFGSHLISTGDIQIGDMIAFMQYAMQVIFSFLMLSLIFIMVPRASVSAMRVAEVIETTPVIVDPEKPLAFPEDGRGVVEFDDVTFSYPGADCPALKDISFAAYPGEITAFVGSTGSGKSTLVNLIPRFYDVTGGRILIDGVDVRDVRQKDLRERLGYVPQKGLLFSGSIAENIKYGALEASDEELRMASATAQADEFIDQLEAGFETPISQGGTNVSGGQRQRLSIARALVKKPYIYIFDDSFSALDFKTDAALRKALGGQVQDATILIVAQRLGTIIEADRIVVLDEGKVVGIGTHRELMDDCLIYQEIAASQLSEEELAVIAVEGGTTGKTEFIEGGLV